MTAVLGRSPWLPFPAEVTPPAGVRLYCLPHAGGSASSYRPWQGRLPGVEVRPLQPPGRETRMTDPVVDRMAPLAQEVAAAILGNAGDGPYAVFGHSLGALVGFEVVREIRRVGGPPPVHFLLSGASAPQWPDEEDDLLRVGNTLTDEHIVSFLRDLGGTPEVFLSDRRVLRMILPPLRADLTVKTHYRCVPEQPLSVPVTAIAATDDPRASVESVAAWAQHTTGPFRLHVIDGGHFAIHDQPDTALRLIGQALRG